MDQVIIFPNDSGGIVLCYPAPGCGLTIEEIARKDVPAGRPYLLVPADQVPEDHTFFGAFEADFSQPHGYGIGADAWFAERAAAELAAKEARAAELAAEEARAAELAAAQAQEIAE